MDKGLQFGAIRFSALHRAPLMAYSGQMKHVVTVNAQFVIESEQSSRFREIINNNWATVDGQVVYYLLKRRYKTETFEKIAGSDFIYDVCRKAKAEGKRVYLLGGKEVSNVGAVAKLWEQFGIEVDGFSPAYSPYPFSTELNQQIMAKIRAFKPHYLFVGFGVLKQEFWIDDHRAELEAMGVELAVGCGGTMEFVSGKFKRAPVWVQKIGMEGVFRLITDPQMARVHRLIQSFKVLKYLFKR